MYQEFDDHDTPSEADLDLCYGSKFLSATELGDRKIRTRIRKVRKALLRGQDGKEKNKFVLSFSNLDKGLVANPTNIKTLVDALGKAPSGWLNAEVGTLHRADDDGRQTDTRRAITRARQAAKCSAGPSTSSEAAGPHADCQGCRAVAGRTRRPGTDGRLRRFRREAVVTYCGRRHLYGAARPSLKAARDDRCQR